MIEQGWVWIIEIQYISKGLWVPTLEIGLTAREAAYRKVRLQRQSDALSLPFPKYRIKRYVRVEKRAD